VLSCDDADETIRITPQFRRATQGQALVISRPFAIRR
jgi:hypothetical protein